MTSLPQTLQSLGSMRHVENVMNQWGDRTEKLLDLKLHKKSKVLVYSSEIIGGKFRDGMKLYMYS